MSVKPKHHRHILTATTILLAISVILISLGFLKTYFDGKVLPGTTLDGEKIALINAEELEAKILQKIEKIENGPYTIILNGLEKNFTAGQLGASTNLEEIRKKLTVFDARKDSLTTIIASSLGNNVEVEINIDKEKAQKNIEEAFEITEIQAKNARLDFNNKGQITIIPEISGEKLNTKSLKKNIEKLINQNISELKLELVEEAAALQADDLFSEKETVEENLKKTVTIKYDRHKWRVKPINHLDWFDFSQEQKIVLKDFEKTLPINSEVNRADETLYEIKPQINVRLTAAFDEYINKEIAPKINTEMQSAKIYYDEKDQVIIEGSALDGKTVHHERLKEMLALAINEEIKSIKAPVKVISAKIEADERLQEQGITELLGVGHTSYYGSPSNRRHNIWVGAKKYNGKLVKQGEEFSFNENLGPVEAHTGYLPELVIKGDEGTIPEYGGGLCQVSSTLYRAALMTGLPITQRRPHSYAVSYYAQIMGFGLDATIYPGVTDVRFVNDTPGDILIQSYVENSNSYFKFYGTSDSRSVELEGPYISNHIPAPATIYVDTPELPVGKKEQKESAHAGFDVDWYRYITKDGKTVKERIYSQYKAIPAKILVGIGKQD